MRYVTTHLPEAERTGPALARCVAELIAAYQRVAGVPPGDGVYLLATSPADPDTLALAWASREEAARISQEQIPTIMRVPEEWTRPAPLLQERSHAVSI